MAQQVTFRVFRVTDGEVLSALRMIRDTHQGNNGGIVNIYVAPGVTEIKGAPEEIASQISEIVQSQTATIQRFFVNNLQDLTIEVTRPPDVMHDQCVVNYTGQDPATMARILIASKKYLRPFELTAEIQKFLGEDLAAHYAKREQALDRLESLVQSQIERIEEHQLRLDARADERQQTLDRKAEEDNARRHLEFEKKEAGLADREAALREERKTLDDNTSKYTRREIYRRLQETLKERSKVSSVSKGTATKRYLLHALYVLLILIPGVVFVRSLWEVASLTSWSGNVLDWARLVRLPVSGLALAAAVIYYIRWNDDWFRKHATEEFRLKRLDLDISRASWLVEMALEWKDEKGTTLPPELINPLTRNLFAMDDIEGEAVRHPAQDLASKLLGASTELNVSVPGVGEAKLDRKAIDRFQKASKDT